MGEFDGLDKRYLSVLDRIERAARSAGRSAVDVMLLAVSKGQPASAMQRLIELTSTLGHRVTFGENYVQEWKAKREQIRGEYRVHMIGPLQRNKAKDALTLFDAIESVHSEGVLEALQKVAISKEVSRDIFLQINISGDPAKSGFSPEEVPRILDRLSQFPNLNLRGLMTITMLFDNPADAGPEFRKMSNLHSQICRDLNKPLELSMGMSGDFEIAISEGATIVRVGTALFGERE